MEIAVAGTREADGFAERVRPALLAMTRLARRLAPPGAGPGGADDIVQDALERAWRKRDQFDPARGTATAWLLAITADRARAARRARLRRLRVLDDTRVVPDGTDGPAGDGATAPAVGPAARAVAEPESGPETGLDLDRAIAALPERQRLAVTLHYYLGLSTVETAQVMGCAAGTVKSTLFDARTKLREALGDDDG